MSVFESNLPRRPYCTDDFSQGLKIRPKQDALKHKYIQPNPPSFKAFLVFDIDREGGAMAWHDVDAPPPLWSSMNPDNGHAHLGYGLEVPVYLGDHARQKPMRFAAAVESGLSTLLKADIGYSGLITKNPTHKHWRTIWWRREPYTLFELEGWVELPKHLPKGKVECLGLGRNCSTFDYLRFYAYKVIREWKAGNYAQWLKHLHDKAEQYTHNEHPVPLHHKESWHLAKSVGKWVWKHFDIEASDKRFSEKQAVRGKLGGKANSKEAQAAKGRKNSKEDQAAKGRLGGRPSKKDTLMPFVLSLVKEGKSQREVAEELGFPRRTIRGWLSG